MLQSSEHETEILLGNKQLVAVFFAGAVLLGLAFTGGYMVGHGSTTKRTTASEPATSAKAPTDTAGTAGETHSVPADDSAGSSAPSPVQTAEPSAAGNIKGTDNLLGARKTKAGFRASDGSPAEKSPKSDNFVPQGGQEFLQVAAVPHDHAMAVAAVLRRKGFHAHAVPKPGDGTLYRVIVGPIRDAGELSSTRDLLRKTGFGQVIVQHYE
ncbi:MAG TPA: SPOR domain-containing protein [Bryobacteraceae bacterium]|nr:SPOR domain-containing protein [Bryobacteraceae bacterium]